jgi:hypothetical protein
MLFLITIGGYVLMFLFIKYYEKKYIYYIAWYVLILLLSSFQIDWIYLNDIEVAFQEQFQSDQWIYYVGVILIILPSLYVAYPLVQMYYYLMLFLKELLDPIVHIPISQKRRDSYERVTEENRDYKNTGLFIFPNKKEVNHETNEE